ncbi:hypothetical protein EG19_04580 [Thermoanaerobaculum aquaticum]|uniref:RHS repeat-associated core domain-containing protein n=1 Tax=Thermoanaerobaculum aquaticum TaxID=1312852 RepID=A0A062XVS7_9BACT|nr:RHS repeat-associated core domain-containing protein [Thermoanaerobaculum aquaticum]KDA53489.1 hypothetical protein EG19_04580 [Thermoanaerobaculum aquaticum]
MGNFDSRDARDYNPNVGRFLGPDVRGGEPASPQSFNLYAYVRNNPVNRIDPTGMVDEMGTAVTDASATSAGAKNRADSPEARKAEEAANLAKLQGLVGVIPALQTPILFPTPAPPSMRAATPEELRWRPEAAREGAAIFVFAGFFLGSQTLVFAETGLYLSFSPFDLRIYLQTGIGGGLGAGVGISDGVVVPGVPFMSLLHQLGVYPLVGGTELLLLGERPSGVLLLGKGEGVYMLERKAYTSFSIRRFLGAFAKSVYTAVRHGYQDQFHFLLYC